MRNKRLKTNSEIILKKQDKFCFTCFSEIELKDEL